MPEPEAEAARRYQSGETQAATAVSLGLSPCLVRRIRAARPVPLRRRDPVTGPHHQAVLDLYDRGMANKEVCAALGLRFTTVHRVLRRTGRVRKGRR